MWYRENEDDDEMMEYRQRRAQNARMYNRCACHEIDPVDLDDDNEEEEEEEEEEDSV